MKKTEDFNNPLLEERITTTDLTKLQTIVVNYVGDHFKGQKEEITVEDIVEVFAKEFPDFLMVVAEENFIRGYEQAMSDLESIKQKND